MTDGIVVTDETLDRAVGEGIVTADQAAALRALAGASAATAAASMADSMADPPGRAELIDEEKLRFVSGFADIFVTIGLALFFGSAAYLVGRQLSPSATSAVMAALAWALAEFFTRRKRMALPSITLLVIFAASSFLALASQLGSDHDLGRSSSFLWLGERLAPDRNPLALATAGIGTAALAALHYWRFRVPITVASGVAALGTTVLALLFGVAPGPTSAALNPILFGIGLGVFALAMRFDLADPTRSTRLTDIAFWLHLLASPLIVHSVFRGIGAGRGTVDPATAFSIIAIFLGLALVALLVDRRAMLVSGLIYAGLAFGSLIRRAGITDLGLPVTLLVLGAFVLLLSAGWTPLRSAILASLPAGLSRRLPAPPAA